MQGKSLFCGHCGRPVIMAVVFHNDIPYHLECTQSPYKQNSSWYREPTFGPLPTVKPQTDSELCKKLTEYFSKEMTPKEGK